MAISTLLSFHLPGESCVSIRLEEDSEVDIGEVFRVVLVALTDDIIPTLNVTDVTILDPVSSRGVQCFVSFTAV